MKPTWAVAFGLAAAILGLSARADASMQLGPRPDAGWSMVEGTADDGIPPELRATRHEDLKEQLLDLIPGETLETVARTLADKKVQLRFSQERAVVVVRLPLG